MSTQPDLSTRIQLVLAECERIIEASETATAGPWIKLKDPDGYWLTYAKGSGPVGITAIETLEKDEMAGDDAAFIATSRTFCPAAAVGIKTAIEAMDSYAHNYRLARLVSHFSYLWDNSVSDE